MTKMPDDLENQRIALQAEAMMHVGEADMLRIEAAKLEAEARQHMDKARKAMEAIWRLDQSYDR